MTLPTIHLNGTSALDLYQQAQGVATAARALLDALEAATPNGRDYYPQGPDALAAAQQAHALSCARVLIIRDEAQAAMEQAADRM